jgi:hypothetical protein
MSLPAISLFLAEPGVQAIASDPFFVVEFYTFRAALLILFIVGLYRLVRNEVRN